MDGVLWQALMYFVMIAVIIVAFGMMLSYDDESDTPSKH